MNKPFELSFRLVLGSPIPAFSAALDNFVDLDDQVNLQIFDNQVNFWTQIPEVISREQIETNELGELKIELDWSKYIAYLQRPDTRRYAESFPDPPDEYYYPDFFRDYDDDETTIFGKLIIPEGIQNTHRYIDQNLIKHYIYPFLYQAFIALNLASPGCFDLSGCYISIGNTRIMDALKLSDAVFAGALHCKSKLDGWPTISSLPLPQTWKWFRSLKLDKKLIAHSTLEKVIFALMHTCEQPYAPHQVLWLSIALEALFDTSPDSSIGKTLRDRIFLVLDEPKAHKKNIKQLISRFYDLRSSFVHGGLEVTHPANPYVFDEYMRKYYDQFNAPIAFATSVVLATLQKHIRNNWAGLEFTEAYQGISLNILKDLH